MSRLPTMLGGFATVALLLGGGCFPQPCQKAPGECPDATFNLRALDDSTVTWMFRGGGPQATTGLVPDPARVGACSFTYEKGRIYSYPDAGADSVIDGFFDLRCNGGDAGTFTFVVSGLGDMRAWSTGTFDLVPTDVQFGVDFMGPGAMCTSASYPGIRLTVTVETAIGGAAPYPKLVTDDFVRTFRLDFDTSSVDATKYRSTDACDLPVVGQVSLHLTQTAAAYLYAPNAPCYCE
jgi:hypothetical protein